MAEYGVTDQITANLNKQFEVHLPLAEANINYNSKVKNVHGINSSYICSFHLPLI